MRGLVLRFLLRFFLAVFLGCCGAMAMSAAQAAQRWPANVCRELAALERMDARAYAGRPAQLATARLNVLMLLQERCAVDVKAKLAADSAAGRAANAATSRAAYRRPRDPLYCTTFRIGEDISHTQCD